MTPDDDNIGNKNNVTVREQRIICIPTPSNSTLINRRVMWKTTIDIAKLLQENLT